LGGLTGIFAFVTTKLAAASEADTVLDSQVMPSGIAPEL
jgi:hypothetical protein